MEIAELWMERGFGMVVEGTVMASVLIGVVLAVQWIVGKRLGPSWRFALWGIVLVRLLLPTAPESRLSLFNAKGWLEKPTVRAAGTERPAMAPLGEMNGSEDVGEFPVEEFGNAPFERTIRWWTVLMAVWAAGVIWHFARLVVGSVWLGRRAARVESDALEAALKEAAQELGMRWKPRVMESSLVASPALFGILRPRLLLPVGFAERMSARELRHVFLHELAHLKRGDLITNALMAVAQGLHWVNPLVWCAMRQMRVERELACDELVLRTAGRESAERRAYGETILRLMEGVPAWRNFSAAVGIAEEKHSARKRMEQIAAFDGARRNGRAAGILLMVVLGMCGLTNAQVERPRSEAGRISDKQVLESAGKEVEKLRDDSMTPRDAGAVSMPMNRGNAGIGRQKIVKKLNEIVIDYYEVPNALPLTEIIKDVYAKARRLDPEKKGVNFIVSSRLDNAGLIAGDEVSALTDSGTEKGPLKVENYRVTISPALRDVTLLGLVEAIVEVAVPPGGHEGAPGLSYVVKDYGVVFGLRAKEAELYTRTFKLASNAFQQGMDFDQDHNAFTRTEGEGRLTVGQEAVRDYLKNAGIDFSVKGKAGGPQRSIFFNERTGELMARLPLEELEIVERAVQKLNARREFQMVISVEAVEVRSRDDLAELSRLMKEPGAEGAVQERFGVLRAVQFRELRKSLGKEFKWVALPRVTTLSGRPAQVEMEGAFGVNVTAKYQEADKAFKLVAAPYDSVVKSQPKEAVIHDGETVVLMPSVDGDAVKPARVMFITVDLIDAAGNKVNAGE
jgi:beta-lactamase regulating signal transducer with metallopeptidase domain